MVIGKGGLTTSPGSRKRVGCPLLIAWSSLGLILCLCGSCTVPSLAGGGDSVGKVVAGYSRLSPECRFDVATMYVFAFCDTTRVVANEMLSRQASPGLVDRATHAWDEGQETWRSFIARGSAELSSGLRNVNPPCPWPPGE
jgi:hypothetical protein